MIYFYAQENSLKNITWPQSRQKIIPFLFKCFVFYEIIDSPQNFHVDENKHNLTLRFGPRAPRFFVKGYVGHLDPEFSACF